MTSINTRNDVVTLINVFTVEPTRQQELVDLLTRATDETIQHMPGFVSATIHKSLDGVRVTNYAQWRSREDLEAMLRNPAASPHLKEAAALATSFEPHLYQVSEVRGVARRQRSQATGAVATGAVALGALAVGACAIGSLAIGRLAIGALALRRAHVHRLAADEVSIGRLVVGDLVVDRT
jgi:quinol monooxygenase YgiN